MRMERQLPGPMQIGTVGMKLGEGEAVLTSTWRTTTPFPRTDCQTETRLLNTITRIHRWLLENAANEARARGNKVLERVFRSNLNRPSPADLDFAELYLFGNLPARVAQADPMEA